MLNVILCTNCGFRNEESATFCGNCGLFLEWVGERVEEESTEGTPQPVEQPIAEPVERTGLIDRVRTAVGLSTDAAQIAADTPGAAGQDQRPIDDPTVETSTGERAPTEHLTRDLPTSPPPAVERAAVTTDPESPTRTRRGGPRRPVSTVASVAPDGSADAAVAGPDEGAIPPPRSSAQESVGRQAGSVASPGDTPIPPTTAGDHDPTRSPPILLTTGAARAAETEAQPAPRDPSARRPVAVPPGRARRKPAPATVIPDRAPAKPGDLVCRSCGTANDPARKFCRACGDSLAVVVPTRPLPWYRRLFVRRQKRPLAAGERTAATRTEARRRNGPRVGYIVRSTLGVLFLLGVIGYVAVPPARVILVRSLGAIVDQARRVIAPRYVIVRPTTEAATSEQPGHEARKAFDQSPKTYWSSDEPEPLLRLAFAQSVNVGALSVYSGANPGFVDLRRPATLQLVPEHGEPTSIELEDVQTEQKIFFDLPATGRLEVRILTTNGASASPVALSELTFFAKE